MTGRLAGRVAIVSGAGPGIGRACAFKLAEDGADVVVAARRSGPLEELAGEVAEATGRRVLAIPTDVKDLDACAALVAGTVSALGRVDVVVNNATHPFLRAKVADYDWSDFDGSVQLNVKGTMKICGEAAKQMSREDGGSIINIGTLSTTAYLAKNMAYSATKAAMITASKTMAREVGRDGIRVNIVTPGYTTGDDLDRLFQQMADASNSTAEEVSARVAHESMLRRHVDPEDIAEAVLFLGSDRGRNITGSELHVTAGALMPG